MKPVVSKILVASHNQGKIKEIRDMLAPFNVEVVSADELRMPDVPETGHAFVENAKLKAETLAHMSGFFALGDDSGLCVKCLGGKLGVLSARYAPNRDFDKAMDMLLDEIKQTGSADRSAYFECVLALADPQGKTYVFEGKVEGKIAEKKAGKKGFGYDPIFVPDGFDKTFAELGEEEKNKISHRGRAFQKLIQEIFA